MDGRLGAFVVPPGGGRAIRGPVGGPTILKAGTMETGGSLAALETVVPPNAGPPFHLHRREDEAWLILEGDFRFRADDELLDAPEGSFVFVPRWTRHCFQNVGSGTGRVLVLFTPSGMERWFERHAELGLPVDPEEYRRISHEHWMEVAGPPLAESHPR